MSETPTHFDGSNRAARISVVIPVHNRKHLLERTLESLRRQTFEDFEVIIVDDGSSDDPESVIRSLDDPRFRILRQERRGAAAARNLGASFATGEFITFLDSDDEAFPTWLAEVIDGFRGSGAEIVCCGLEKVGVGREVVETGGVRLPRDLGPMFGHMVGIFSHAGAFAMHKSVFDSIGGYALDLRSGQNTELSMRLIPRALEEGWRIHNIYRPLIRIHVHQGPRIRGNAHNIFHGSMYTLAAHGELFKKDPATYGNYLSVAGVNAWRLGKSAMARKLFARAILANPSRPVHAFRLLISLVPRLADRVWRNTRNSKTGTAKHG